MQLRQVFEGVFQYHFAIVLMRRMTGLPDFGNIMIFYFFPSCGTGDRTTQVFKTEEWKGTTNNCSRYYWKCQRLMGRCEWTIGKSLREKCWEEVIYGTDVVFVGEGKGFAEDWDDDF